MNRWFYNTSQPPEIQNYYQKISSEFCKYYYCLWDKNFPLIGNLYSNDIKITFLNRNMNGILQLINYVKTQGIWKFNHGIVSGTSQPIDNNTILINIVGEIAINDSPYYHKYTETLIIKRNIWGDWYITSNIFRLVPFRL